MNLRFGVPKKEVVNKEMFPDNPVLTMEHVEDKGFNRRFTLNKKALEVLNITPGEDSVAFAFDGVNEKVYIAKLNSEDSVLVGKNKAFSNKRYYEYIAKFKQLDLNKDNYFELTNPVDILGMEAYEIVLITTNTTENEPVSPIIDKEIEHLTEEKSTAYEDYNAIVADYEPHGDVW